MIVRPNRARRRAVSGSPCTACLEPMHADDIASVSDSARVAYFHAECLNTLADRMHVDTTTKENEA